MNLKPAGTSVLLANNPGKAGISLAQKQAGRLFYP